MNLIKLFSQQISPEFLPKNDLSKSDFIINTIFAIAGAIAVIMVVYAGVQLIISQGNSEKVAKARRAIIYAIVGLIVMLSAWLIVGYFVNAIT